MGPSNRLPSDQTFRAHFGSIPKAYELAGLEMSRASLHACKGSVASVANHRAAKEFRAALTALGCSPRSSGSLIKVEGLRPFLFKVARYRKNKRGEFGWRISMRHTPQYPCAVARLDSNNDAVLDWILLPHLPNRLSQFTLSEPQVRPLDCVRNTAAELATVIRERLQVNSLAGISDHNQRRSHGKAHCLPLAAGGATVRAVAVEEHEDVRIGAPINPQCSAERMDFAIEEWLHGAIHEHWFQLLDAADRDRTSEHPYLVDSRCDLLKSVS